MYSLQHSRLKPSGPKLPALLREPPAQAPVWTAYGSRDTAFSAEFTPEYCTVATFGVEDILYDILYDLADS